MLSCWSAAVAGVRGKLLLLPFPNEVGVVGGVDGLSGYTGRAPLLLPVESVFSSRLVSGFMRMVDPFDDVKEDRGDGMEIGLDIGEC